MYARSTSFHGDPHRIDDAVRYVRDRAMPALMGMDGFVGISMLADRRSGRSVITSSFEDLAALRRSDDIGARFDGAGAQQSFPMRLSGRGGEGGRHGEDARALAAHEVTIIEQAPHAAERLAGHCDRVEPLPPVSVSRGERRVTTFQLWHCQGWRREG